MILGSAAVEYINTPEPSGSSAVSLNNCNVNDFGDSDEVMFGWSTSSVPPKKRKQNAVYNRPQAESWKEKYFQNMVDNEKNHNEASIRKADLKSYNLLLRNISLEKSLELKEHEVVGLRSSISPRLMNFPIHFSEFAVVEEDKPNSPSDSLNS